MNSVLPIHPPVKSPEPPVLPPVPESLSAALTGLLQPAPASAPEPSAQIAAPEPALQPRHNGGGRPSKQLEAQAWLQQFLRAGSKPSTEVKARGQEKGFSSRTLERCKDEMQLRVVQRLRQWFWELP